MTDMNGSNRCPCGSGQAYEECCGLFLDQGMSPETARALMRSRYTAYVRLDAGYLLATWHSSTRPSALRFGDDDRVNWTGLTVLASHRGEVDDLNGEVEFVARFRKGAGEFCMGERSRFVREEGRWVYVDGAAVSCDPSAASNKTGRNAPCPCGSGRKFKRCCGQGRPG